MNTRLLALGIFTFGFTSAFATSVDSPEARLHQLPTAFMQQSNSPTIKNQMKSTIQTITSHIPPNVRTASILIVPVDYINSPARAWTREQIQNHWDGGTIVQFFFEQSFGKFAFTPTVSNYKRVNHTGDSNSQCSANGSTALEGGQTMSQALIAEGLNPTQFDFVLYAHTCNILTGNGSAGNPRSIQIRGGVNVAIDTYMAAHEIGHVLGQFLNVGTTGHAASYQYCSAANHFNQCGIRAYGNFYDRMGSGWYGWHYNADTKRGYKWISESNVIRLFKNVGDHLDRNVDLYPIEKAMPASPNGQIQPGHVVYVYTPGSEQPIFMIEKRAPYGFDTNLSNTSAGSGVLIYTKKLGTGSRVDYPQNGSLQGWRLVDVHHSAMPETSYVLLGLNPQGNAPISTSVDNDMGEDQKNAALTLNETFFDPVSGVKIKLIQLSSNPLGPAFINVKIEPTRPLPVAPIQR